MIELIEKTKDKIVIKIKVNSLNRINANNLKEELIPMLKEYRDLIIDFSNLNTIDCYGFGQILFLKEKLEEKNGELKIINAESEYLKNFFSLVKNDLEIV